MIISMSYYLSLSREDWISFLWVKVFDNESFKVVFNHLFNFLYFSPWKKQKKMSNVTVETV